MLALYVNALLYIVTTIILFIRKRHSLISFLWLLYSLFAIMGVIVVDTGIYDVFGKTSNYNFRFTPYILNYVALILTTFPLRRFSFGALNIKEIRFSKKFENIFNILFFFFIILIVARLFEIRLYGNLDVGERHEQIIAGGESLLTKESHPILWLINVTIGRLYIVTYPLVIIYVFYRLTNKTRYWKTISIFILCLMPDFLECYVSGNRSSLFFLVINLFFFIILFYKYIKKTYIRKTIFFLLLAGIPFFVVVKGISVARFEDTELGVSGSVFRYFGEAFPNLDFQYWKHVKSFTMGGRDFPSIYSIIAPEKVKQFSGFNERFDFWSYYTGVSTANFKTLFGDLYIEFGTYGALIFVFVLSLLMEIYIKNQSKLRMSNIMIIYVYFCYCTNAILNFPMLYFGSSWLKNYVAIFLLMLLLKYFEKKKLIRYEKCNCCSCDSQSIK